LDPRLSYNGSRENYVDDTDLLAGLDKLKAVLEEVDDLPSGSPVKFNVFKCYGGPTISTTISKNELEDYFRLTGIPEPFKDADPST
jgi:hypothetical protein